MKDKAIYHIEQTGNEHDVDERQNESGKATLNNGLQINGCAK